MIRHYLVTVEAADDPDATPAERLDESAALHRAIGQTLSSSTFHTFRGRGVSSVTVTPAVSDVRRRGDHWVARGRGTGGWVAAVAEVEGFRDELERVTR